MMNFGMWLIEKDFLRPMLLRSNTEFCFFTAQWTFAYTSDIVSEPSNGFKHFASIAGATAIRIAYYCQSFRQTPITATHHTVKFFWKPSWPFAQPQWLNFATNS